MVDRQATASSPVCRYIRLELKRFAGLGELRGSQNCADRQYRQDWTGSAAGFGRGHRGERRGGCCRLDQGRTDARRSSHGRDTPGSSTDRASALVGPPLRLPPPAVLVPARSEAARIDTSLN